MAALPALDGGGRGCIADGVHDCEPEDPDPDVDVLIVRFEQKSK